jgi:hypothetical protein
MTLEQLQNKEIKVHEISWIMIDKKVAEGLQIKREHVTALRNLPFNEDSIATFGDRKQATKDSTSPNSKLTNNQLTRMIKEANESHSQGETVTCNKMKNFK